MASCLQAGAEGGAQSGREETSEDDQSEMKLNPARERQQLKLSLDVTIEPGRKREDSELYRCVLELRRRGYKVYRAGYDGFHIRHMLNGRAVTVAQLRDLAGQR